MEGRKKERFVGIGGILVLIALIANCAAEKLGS